jgi:hypothetical protein
MTQTYPVAALAPRSGVVQCTRHASSTQAAVKGTPLSTCEHWPNHPNSHCTWHYVLPR